MGQSQSLVAVAGLFVLVTSLAMQFIKPLLEKIPGIMLPQNQDAHDGLLRLVQYGLNFGLLMLATATTPAIAAGLQWYDLMAIAFGQSLASHVVYATLTAGKTDNDTPADQPASRSSAPPAVTSADIPTVPR